jgi:hypothetical protein
MRWLFDPARPLRLGLLAALDGGLFVLVSFSLRRRMRRLVELMGGKLRELGVRKPGLTAAVASEA